jgi:HD superfamily phosphohydrolase YqeK
MSSAAETQATNENEDKLDAEEAGVVHDLVRMMQGDAMWNVQSFLASKKITPRRQNTVLRHALAQIEEL